MKCPSCKLKGVDTEMVQGKVKGRPDLVALECPVDRTHWEIMPKKDVEALTK